MTCKCTHSALCRACRAVLALDAIAADLECSGWKHEADKIVKIANELRVKLQTKDIPF